MKIIVSPFASAGVPTADCTTSYDTAREWYENGDTVCARALRSASGGAGISIHAPSTGVHEELHVGDSPEQQQYALDDPLPRLSGRGFYTRYFKRATEYRIHVFGGRILDVQQKRKRQEVPNEEVNYQIRNFDNGWVFCRDNVNCPDSCLDAARRAVDCLGLTFGAVDIGYNEHYRTPCVFEVNTAPGLEGTTIDKYVEAFTDYIPELRGGAYARRRQQAC